MEVEIKLFSGLKRYAPEDENVFMMELDEDATVGQVVTELGIPANKDWIALIDGRRVTEDTLLEDYSTLVLFSAMDGG